MHSGPSCFDLERVLREFAELSTYAAAHTHAYIHTHTHTYIYIYIHTHTLLDGQLSLLGNNYRTRRVQRSTERSHQLVSALFVRHHSSTPFGKGHEVPFLTRFGHFPPSKEDPRRGPGLGPPLFLRHRTWFWFFMLAGLAFPTTLGIPSRR
ncbi:hypothetical protein CGRA01v4_00032 [Colletotrichum graminicola]|nr:hypothetical protein CGRA01v4_00032 [Colletotrichum graminicola]